MDTITAGSTIVFAMELNEKGLWNNGLLPHTKALALVTGMPMSYGIFKEIKLGLWRDKNDNSKVFRDGKIAD